MHILNIHTRAEFVEFHELTFSSLFDLSQTYYNIILIYSAFVAWYDTNHAFIYMFLGSILIFQSNYCTSLNWTSELSEK